ncbi:hypothetical protein [Streptomyces sp. A5-4]|uniref:hypothetical protein n=1 Tax=Streptomyces sp. A5-4 TaxID=3384771 RepID=UPI003DAA22DD
MAQQQGADPAYRLKIYGCLFLMVFGAFALFFIGLPSGEGDVKCGDQVMSPGDHCNVGGGRQINADGSSAAASYDEMAASNHEQHAGDPASTIAGSALLVVGSGLLALVVWSHRKPAAPPQGRQFR